MRNLTDEEIDHLVSYVRCKFEDERYPFAPALRPVREVLSKLDPKPLPNPPSPRKPYIPSLVAQRKRRR